MSLFMDIGQGAGLAGATGVRPFLPPLLAGGLARGDIGIDFDGSDWRFLESTGFLLAVFALAVLTYAFERSAANRAEGSTDTEAAATGGGRSRRPLDFAFGALGIILGALLFAGTLAEEGNAAWPGLIAGAVIAALAYVALGALFERVRARLDSGAAALVEVYGEGLALLLAAIAIVLPPASFLALVAFVVLLVTGRRQAERKFAGLRILR